MTEEINYNDCINARQKELEYLLEESGRAYKKMNQASINSDEHFDAKYDYDNLRKAIYFLKELKKLDLETFRRTASDIDVALRGYINQVEKPRQTWSHIECQKAAKVFKKHGIKCRVYKTKLNSYQGGDSYLILYVNKINKKYINGMWHLEQEFDCQFRDAFSAACKECRERGIDYTTSRKPYKK